MSFNISQTDDRASGTGPAKRRLLDRRPIAFAYIELDDDNAGTLLNLSESGLAVQTLICMSTGADTRMRFQFSGSDSWIDAKGRVAWTSESRKVAGIDFVDLPPSARDQIRKALSSELSARCSEEEFGEHVYFGVPMPFDLVTNRTDPSETLGSFDEVDQPDTVISLSASNGPETVHGLRAASATDATTRELFSAISTSQSSKKTWLFALLIGGLGLTALVLTTVRNLPGASSSELIGHLNGIVSDVRSVNLQLSKRVESQLISQKLEQPIVASRPSSSIVQSPVSVPAPSARPPATTQSEPSQFGLQVAALTNKEGADSLAESLIHAGLTVQVFRPARLYKVILGPFNDATSASAVTAELKKQNLNPIRVDWATKQ